MMIEKKLYFDYGCQTTIVFLNSDFFLILVICTYKQFREIYRKDVSVVLYRNFSEIQILIV